MFTRWFRWVNYRAPGVHLRPSSLAPMRQQYHEQLEDISNGLVELTQLVGDAMGRATRALLETDLQAAESVIASDVDIDERADALESLALDVIALQAPVAGELRSLVGALRMSATLERMGDLAEHIARIARRRYPDPVVPEELVPTLREMGELAVRLAYETGDIINSVDVAHALRLETEDDRMDELHRQMFMTMLAPDWSHGVESAIDITLISRFYERFADHAVSVARRVVHQATGNVHKPWSRTNPSPSRVRTPSVLPRECGLTQRICVASPRLRTRPNSPLIRTRAKTTI